ncbi:hypothetical protein, variant [Sphaeroforma arctica JP610]|uniref:Endonuclease/exonuclease/phosphatase domain-containing protein n=2 Tax=Sphaeroforma arctica JP610 TaxID=667725 RepID=A0A0L0FMX1_9EUKA|nr:hypothetical protein, variant [Sphaeroforma arctica JP610]KNC78110.1 hypothetical protein, variant [Sphaeroforma arctica JP610]|eukprot:XP_014152012.1 hypothetical protein, variant [Sphaeroforma arctica JP610]
MEWPGLSLLHTYAPNNGGSEISWLKRRTWDADVKRFLSDDVHEGKNLIWCGDLNVSPTDSDLSHPEFFRRQFHGEQKDRKRFPEYVGQAGCTDRERELFQEILDTAKMVDLYRYKHPSNTGGIQDPLYSWRGGEGKYHCKGMRIDHFIGTTNLLERIEDVSIEGRGTQRLGFIGSDHSPISIHIRGADGDPKTGKEEDTSAKDEQITHAKESEHLGLHQDPL